MSSMPLLAETMICCGWRCGCELGDDGAEMLRGSDAEEDVGGGGGAEEVGGDADVGGEDEAGEVAAIFAGVVELFGVRGGVGPEAELVSAAAGEGESERGAPGSGAEDRRCGSCFAFLWCCFRIFLSRTWLSVPIHEAADVGVVFRDADDGDEDEAEDEFRRVAGSEEEHEDGNADRRDDGCERNVARSEGDEDEDAEGASPTQGRARGRRRARWRCLCRL